MNKSVIQHWEAQNREYINQIFKLGQIVSFRIYRNGFLAVNILAYIFWQIGKLGLGVAKFFLLKQDIIRQIEPGKYQERYEFERN